MEHQWFCGGKEPCACMDSWKEAELEKDRAQAERDQMRRTAHSELGGGHSAAEIDQWLDSLESLTYGETIAKAAAKAERAAAAYAKTIGELDAGEIDRRLDVALGSIREANLASPIGPIFEAIAAKIKEEKKEADFTRRKEGDQTMPGGPGPSSVPPFGPLPCDHEWAFLRNVEYKPDVTFRVDVFFCRRCLTYREMEG